LWRDKDCENEIISRGIAGVGFAANGTGNCSEITERLRGESNSCAIHSPEWCMKDECFVKVFNSSVENRVEKAAA
jgi:hypothetical protein